MNVIQKMINDYAAKGFKPMCKADGYIMKSKVKYGMYKYSSKLEKKIADRVERFLDSDDDWMLYNETTGQVLVANAEIKGHYVTGFAIWELCHHDNTVKEREG